MRDFRRALRDEHRTAFCEDPIDVCLMEWYFREHMAKSDLLFHDTVAPHLVALPPIAPTSSQ